MKIKGKVLRDYGEDFLTRVNGHDYAVATDVVEYLEHYWIGDNDYDRCLKEYGKLLRDFMGTIDAYKAKNGHYVNSEKQWDNVKDSLDDRQWVLYSRIGDCIEHHSNTLSTHQYLKKMKEIVDDYYHRLNHFINKQTHRAIMNIKGW